MRGSISDEIEIDEADDAEKFCDKVLEVPSIIAFISLSSSKLVDEVAPSLRFGGCGAGRFFLPKLDLGESVRGLGGGGGAFRFPFTCRYAPDLLSLDESLLVRRCFDALRSCNLALSGKLLFRVVGKLKS